MYNLTSNRAFLDAKRSIDRVSDLLEASYNRIIGLLPTVELKDVLPISFKAFKAALIIRNKSASAFLLGKFEMAEGVYTHTKVNLPASTRHKA